MLSLRMVRRSIHMYNLNKSKVVWAYVLLLQQIDLAKEKDNQKKAVVIMLMYLLPQQNQLQLRRSISIFALMKDVITKLSVVEFV